MSEISKVGKRGTVVMPARLRRKYGIAVAYPIEIYTPERRAELILSSAIDEDDYQGARETVRLMGLDPDRITHLAPR